MARFSARGGWWVAGQAVLLAAYGAALLAGESAATAPWVRIALAFPGVVLLAVAAWLAAGGVRALGSGLTPYPEPQAGATLVCHGVYGIVRHPLYGAVVLGAAGLALIAASPGAALVTIALAGFFGAKSTFEERRLMAAYPGYEAYRRQVRWRMIPGVL